MDWVRRQNIKRFERLIESEADPTMLAHLEALLQEERNRLAALLAPEQGVSDLGSPSPLQLQRALLSADVLSLVADSVICTDQDGRIVLFNRAAEQSFGYSAPEVTGEHVEMLLPQRHRAQHVHQVRSFALEDGEIDRLMGHQREVSGVRKNGEEFPAEAAISRHSVDGRTILTVVVRDIAERKELEEQREGIAKELDHRIRNVLTVVSSLVSLSARTATSATELRDSLQQRLKALAATQNLIQRGTRGNIKLSDLLLAELDVYRSPDGANVIVEVEPVVLSPTAVQPLALAVHELATNSAKYGALSDPRGRVIVTMEAMSERDKSLLAIEWREMGGPPVKPPDRQGFGTKFIEQVIKQALQAEIIVDYRPEGLVCRMILPRAKVEAVPAE